jgi:DNA-directed RNA polymerase specialized sigma24 family protein
MIPSDDIPLILLKERLELLAYVSLFTRDSELVEDVFRHVCEKALWRVDGFESAAQLLAYARQAAHQRVLELESGGQPVVLGAETLAALETEWARREEGTTAEELEALGQCLAQLSQIHFESIERRYLSDETARELAARRALTIDQACGALAKSQLFIQESTRRKLTEAPC